MSKLAIVGGSGVPKLEQLKITRKQVVHTPYGPPSALLTHGVYGDGELIFLPRHGPGHTIPPHRINYRANLWALKSLGVQRVLAVAAVGGIRQDLKPGSLVVPDQIIDYTWGRDHTLFDADLTQVTHIDFTEPYCEELRQWVLRAAESLHQPVAASGTYAATQGPRLETAAEINRFERDGCDMVGMTGMPEASLAREFGLCYACCALVVNWAAGRGEGAITMAEIDAHLKTGTAKVRSLLNRLVTLMDQDGASSVSHQGAQEVVDER